MAEKHSQNRELPSEGSTPEEKARHAIDAALAVLRQNPNEQSDDVAQDQTLFDALDAISGSIESNIERWNSELDLIEEDLSHSMALTRHVEAAQ